MAYTKYKFIPRDIAGYLLIADLPHKRQNEVICDLFENHNAEIFYTFRTDFLKFRSEINDLMSRLELDSGTLNEAELIIREVRDMKAEENEREPDYFGAYFKLIKLQLMYSGATYKKIKLRTLLNDFGYKRRSSFLIKNINRTLKALELAPYLKNHKPCDLSKVKIGDMIIIRLYGDKEARL